MAEVTLTIDDANAAALLADHRIKVTEWTLERPSGELRLIAQVTRRISLPADVGAIIAYLNSSGHQRRAIRNPRGWDVYGLHGSVLMNQSHERMTEHVENGTGYEVIIPGFPPLASSVKDSVDAIVAKIARAGTAGGGLL